MKGSRYRAFSGVAFGLVAVGHLIRAALQLPAQVGTTPVPMWVSWAAVVVAGGLCVWAFRGSE
jgi:hypothetical protein